MSLFLPAAVAVTWNGVTEPMHRAHEYSRVCTTSLYGVEYSIQVDVSYAPKVRAFPRTQNRADTPSPFHHLTNQRCPRGCTLRSHGNVSLPGLLPTFGIQKVTLLSLWLPNRHLKNVRAQNKAKREPPIRQAPSHLGGDLPSQLAPPTSRRSEFLPRPAFEPQRYGA